MAYPTGMLSLTLEDIDRRLADLKRFAQQTRDEAAAGNLPATRILHLYSKLKQEKAALQAAASVSGIAAYAQEQKNQPGLDVVAEFNNVVTTIDGVAGWISTNFPKDGSGFILAQTFGALAPVDRVFTPAQTAGLRTQLDSLIATIA